MLVKVKNRSNATSVYTIPELGDRTRIRREFAPGESKNIDLEELKALIYIPGGETLLMDYLQIQDAEALKELQLDVEPEYNMSRNDIINLLQSGSMDSFLDCLDFAPEGVLDLIKELAVELPLTDSRKREAIKEKMGLDVDKAIQNKKEAEEAVKAAKEKNHKERRVKIEKEENTEKEVARRTSTPSYKVVGKKDD